MYLLLDSGYYKPNYLQNAVTAYAPSHNVILIEGGTTPEKGLLTDFGDGDALVENALDGELVVVRLSGPGPFALLARGTHVTLDGETLATLSGDDQVVLEESAD